MSPIAVLFNNVGPYHLARLRAISRLGELTCIETFRHDQTYSWHAIEDASFARVTLFDETGPALPRPAAIRSRVIATLQHCAPSAVVIHGWSDPAAVAALEWCVGRSIPTVLMSASQARDEQRRWWKEFPKRQLVSLYGAAVCGGSPQASYLRQLGMDPARILPGYDVVDNEHFERGARAARADAKAMRTRLGLPDRYLLASNRFVQKKNLPRLLQAFCRYRRAGAPGDWRLVMLGDGEMRAELERLVAAERMGEHVVFAGFRQYAELPAYYGLAEAFIQASTTEQWGLVVNEAMAAGCPVLVSEPCGCAQDLVAAGVNGFTFDPLDVDAMTRLISDLATRGPGLRDLGAASLRIISRFTPRIFADNVMTAITVARSRIPTGATPLQQLIFRMLAAR